MRVISAIKKDASAAYAKYTELGFTASVFSFFQGRATAFAILFTVVGIRLAFLGKLDANYALFVTAIQGLVFAHSCKEDWFAWKNPGAQPPAAPPPGDNS